MRDRHLDGPGLVLSDKCNLAVDCNNSAYLLSIGLSLPQGKFSPVRNLCSRATRGSVVLSNTPFTIRRPQERYQAHCLRIFLSMILSKDVLRCKSKAKKQSLRDSVHIVNCLTVRDVEDLLGLKEVLSSLTMIRRRLSKTSECANPPSKHCDDRG